MEQGVTGIELCAPKEVTGGRDVVQSREEDLDPIDRDLAKFDQNRSGVSANDAPTSLFTMGSKFDPSRTTVLKVSHWQKAPRKNKEQGSVLVKRVTREFDEEMK
nr:hypothetical protein CFP56_08535 [Quercus suber]